MKLGLCDSYHHSTQAKLGDNKYAILKALGFSALDFGLANVDDLFYTAPTDIVRKLLTDIRARIEDAGLFVSQIHGPWTWPPSYDATQEARRVRLEQMKCSIDMTAALGCRHWVIHPLMPFACRDTLLHKEQEALEINRSFMRELLPYAEQRGVIICLENMPMKTLAMASPAAILRFVQEIDSAYFKVCLDTGHTTMVSDRSLADVVRLLGDELRVLHIHDNGGEHDEHLLPGKGIIDWHAFVDALHDIAFDGVFSLEALPSKDLPDDAYKIALADTVRQLKAIDPTFQ